MNGGYRSPNGGIQKQGNVFINGYLWWVLLGLEYEKISLDSFFLFRTA